MEPVVLGSDYLSENESRGRYYRFESGVDGSVVLKPVKVPAHVIAERKARIRKMQIEKRVKHNREQAALMNRNFVAFMTVAIIICCVVCYFYISLQGEVTTRLRTMSTLQREIDALATENDMLEKRIGVQEDISKIKYEATETLGMQTVTPDQIVYYSVSDKDYMLQFEKIE